MNYAIILTRLFIRDLFDNIKQTTISGVCFIVVTAVILAKKQAKLEKITIDAPVST